MSKRVAIYARFSTDRQNESSIEDQVRACTDYATRQSWVVVQTYDDKGISGAALGNRPGVQQLQKDAASGAFDVLLVTDLSRLSRNQGDLPKLIARLTQKRIRVIGVQDGTDTSRKGYKLQVGVSGIVGEAFREMVRDRTALSLRMRAEQGYHTGGAAYGYKSQPADPTDPEGYKRLHIEETQAATVRRVFEMYADGHSPLAIAAQLNAEAIPSPGAKWKRTKRRTDGKWLNTSVLSILANELYTGRVIYGRRQYMKDDDSGIRSPSAPTESVIERQEERLRVVPPELWHRVQARKERQSADLGVRVRTGLRKRRNKNQYLLSGSLRCEACRSAFAMSNGTRYQCASHHGGGAEACEVSLSVPRDRIERVFREYMAGPELPRQLSEIEARWLSSQAAQVDFRPRISELEMQRANLIEAIKAGGLAGELGAELKALSAELERMRMMQLSQMPATPRFTSSEPIERRVARLLERMEQGGDVARGVVRELFPGGIWLYPDPNGGRYLWAHAQTALPGDWLSKRDACGYLPPEHWPRVYNVMVNGSGQEVAGSGSGGRI